MGPTDRVRVLGASGGVGSLAVQLAKACGATVWGQTTNKAKVDGIAADHVVVADDTELAAALDGFEPTVVLDCLGGGYTKAAVDDTVAAPTAWNVETGANIRWKTPVPGLTGGSRPVIPPPRSRTRFSAGVGRSLGRRGIRHRPGVAGRVLYRNGGQGTDRIHERPPLGLCAAL